MDLGISTTYRLLGTLKYKNYIEQNPLNLKYKLGYEFLNKAFLVSNDEANIVKKSMPYLENLRDFTKESISLAVLNGRDIVYIAKADSYEVLRTNIEIGKKFPAYKTALGKMLLAYLSPEQFNRLFDKDKLLISDPCFNLNISEFKQYLKKAREEGSVLVLYGHAPDSSNERNFDGGFSVDTLEEILRYVRDHEQFDFYRRRPFSL